MPSRVARIVLTARDLASPKIRGLGGALGKLGALAVAVGAGAIGRKLVRGIGAAVTASAEQEKQERQLQSALRETGQFSRDVQAQLLRQADDLARLTGKADEAIISQQALFLSFGASADQASKAAEAAQNYGAVIGNADQAARQIAKTLGGYAGELGEVIPELKNFTKEQLQAGEAIDLINEKFAGRAAAQLDTYVGSVEELTNAWGDLKETLGGPVREVLTAVFRTLLTPAIRDLNDAAKESDALRMVVLELALTMAHFGKTLESIARFFAPVLDSLQLMKVKAELAWAQLLFVTGQLDKSGEDAEGAASRFDALIKALEELIANGPKAGDAVGEGGKKAAEGLSALDQALTDLGIATEGQQIEKIVALSSAIDLARQAFESGAISAQTYQRVLDELMGQAAGIPELAQPFRDQIKAISLDIRQIGIRAVMDFGNAIADFLVDGERRFRDFFKSIIKQMVAAVAQAAILAAILAGLPGGGTFGSQFKRILGFAKGGVVPGLRDGGVVTGAAGPDRILARVSAGERWITPHANTAIENGKAALVSLDAPTGGSSIAELAQSLRGSVLEGDGVADWLERNAEGLAMGLRFAKARGLV